MRTKWPLGLVTPRQAANFVFSTIFSIDCFAKKMAVAMAMSTNSSYLGYIFAVISNSIVAALGMIASIGIPWYLLEQLKTMSEPSRKVPLNSTNATHSRNRSVNAFWDAMLGGLLAFTSFGYVICGYIFWLDLDSVAEAVLWSTGTVIGISFGIAIAGAGVIYLGRAAGWMG
jgi:hypothetical protein